jgi:hypothetical protein
MLNVGDTRTFGTLFQQGKGGAVHGDIILKRIFELNAAIFGDGIELLHIGEVDFLRKVRVGEWLGIAFKLDYIEENSRVGIILTVSFRAIRISTKKPVFQGSYRFRISKSPG